MPSENSAQSEDLDDWLNDSEDDLQAEDTIWETVYVRHRARFLALRDLATAETDVSITRALFENPSLADAQSRIATELVDSCNGRPMANDLEV